MEIMQKMTLEIQLIGLLRLVIALFLGIMVGYERRNRHKEAGIKTHAIVAMGSALVMLISKYGFFDVAEYDGSRIAAQIISGVGFLGAGIIFVKDNGISGLTTAAGVWAISGVGMAIGAGLYILGIGATILMLLTQIMTHRNYTG